MARSLGYGEALPLMRILMVASSFAPLFLLWAIKNAAGDCRL